MRTSDKRRAPRAAGAALGLLVIAMASANVAGADESVAAEVAGAVLENPDCVGATIANQAVEEGVRRGRRLLSRLGINARGGAAPVPCGSAATADAPGAQAADTSATPAAAAASTAATAATAATAEAAGSPAEPAQRRGLFSGLRSGQNGQGRNQRNCGALGAGCADGMTPLVACMNEVSFWGEMATAVERKRDAGAGLSAAQVAEMNADIAAMRAAHAAGAGRVEAADPSRPNRHIDWLTPEEYSVAATAASQKLNSHREDCNRRHARF